MTEKEPVRIDKFLWAVRIYKTRNLASDACRMGRVLINNTPAKPSHYVKPNETLILRKPPVIFTFKVIEPLENRVSAKLVAKYIEDLTPESEKNKIAKNGSGSFICRKKGSGRPTKKERRIMDSWQDGFSEI
jgi:ribosome-associated heat shock protein Hsp15